MQNYFIRLLDDSLRFIKKYKFIIILSIFCFILGIVLGSFCVDNNISFLKILNSYNRILLDFIKGDVKPFTLFFNKTLEIVLIFSLIFLFSLSLYSCFLCFTFLIFQGLTLTLISATIIRAYSFGGILNVIFILTPLNIIWFCSIFIMISLSVARAYEAKKYNLTFSSSFKYFGYFKKFSICIVVALIIAAVYSFIIPLLLKSFVYVVY